LKPLVILPCEQAVVKLLIAGEFVSTVDVTEASALIGAAEQNILLRADRMKASLRAMSAAAQVLVADASVPYRNISWSLPGVATQNVTNEGRRTRLFKGIGYSEDSRELKKTFIFMASLKTPRKFETIIELFIKSSLVCY